MANNKIVDYEPPTDYKHGDTITTDGIVYKLNKPLGGVGVWEKQYDLQSVANALGVPKRLIKGKQNGK